MLLAVTPKVEQRRLLRFFTLLPTVVGFVVAAIGLIELVFSMSGIESLQSSAADRVLMMPVTAVCFIIAGMALVAAHAPRGAHDDALCGFA